MLFKPHGYQEYAIGHILENNISGLFLDMGLGKTVSTLTAIDGLIAIGEAEKVLVIAPKRVALDTWSTEVEKWDHLNLRISKILGTEKQRIRALYSDADVYIINRDNVTWLINKYFKTWDFDTLIIDELSSFKSSKSQRFRALKKVRPFFKRIIGLTGTPAPNSLEDLWSQVYLMDGGKRLGKTITGYREKYFYPQMANGHIVYKYGLKDNAESEIYKSIADICVSMKAEDYLELPDAVYNRIEIDLGVVASTKYKSLEKELVLADEEITAVNAAVLTQKLLQLSNGAIYNDYKEVIEIHDEKLKALDEIIESAQGNPILLFYNFQHDYDRIIEHLPKSIKVKKLETSEDIKKWNEGKIDIALVHPASAGHGLNLQYGGNIIVWFSLTWSLELYQQANARLHRQGQTKTVIIHHLIAKSTVDEDVMSALEGKEVNQNKLMEAIKARYV